MDVVRGAGDESRVQVVQTVRIELAQPLIHSAKPVVRYEILPQDRIQVADIVARADDLADAPPEAGREIRVRSEEHTSELQSLMRISYAVYFLKQKKSTN